MRIAIIGAGIAGLTAAHRLGAHHEVTVFDAAAVPGGHAHTVDVVVEGREVAVDTGFLVYNDRTYPNFIALLDELSVPTHESDMSFSVVDPAAGLEWCGTSPCTAFADPANLLRPSFWAMLVDVVRFNRTARRLAAQGGPPGETLEQLLQRGRYSQAFRNWYLVPMGSAIWSADPDTFTEFPAVSFAEFFQRHGLLEIGDQPQWRTITGGSRRYVEAICAPLRARGRLHLSTKVTAVRQEDGVAVLEAGEEAERFDHVVLALHGEDALALLGDPTEAEQEVLSAHRYQANLATLHTDASILPRREAARASWNYLRVDDHGGRATLTYDLNRLQGLGLSSPLLLTLNRDQDLDPALVLGRFEWAHPVVDPAAVAARARQRELTSATRSYCGAYWGSGFHEDGVVSALTICDQLLGA